MFALKLVFLVPCVAWIATGSALADEHAEVNAVLDKAVKALGGDKLAKLNAVSWKGKAALQIGGQDITLVHDGVVQGSDRYKVDMEIQVGGNNNKVLFVINGDKAWARSDNQTNDLPKEVAGFARDGFHGMRIVHALSVLNKDKAYKVSHLGELKIGERAVVGLRISHKDRRDVSLFFDKDTGLPAKSETSVTTPDNQEVNVEYHYSDYKDFAGIKHFAKITFKVNDQEYSTELSDLKAEEMLEAGTFDKP